MGFGWLLVGYFFANVIPHPSLSIAMLAGYPLMIFGLWRLSPYYTRFYRCFFVSLLSLPFAVYFSLYGLSEFGLFTLAFLGGTVYVVVEWLYFTFSLWLHAMLLLAVSGLAVELRLYRHQSAALRNLVFMALYGVLYPISKLPFLKDYGAYFALPLLLLRFLYVFLNVWLLFHCHRFICPEGDEWMPETTEKRSRSGRSLEQEEMNDER